MAFIIDDAFVSGLTYISTNAEQLEILNADPGGTWSNIALYTVGQELTPVVNAPAAVADGYDVVVDAITAGDVSCTLTESATHWALTNVTGTEILASGALTTPQDVTDGNTFTLTAINIGMRDATAV